MTWLLVGTTILRRYVLLRPIGRGGVSVVYQAIDVDSARPFAVKLLAPAAAGDRRARDDIRREASFTQRLRHPSVPRVYDVGELPLPGGGTSSYVVMELICGESLADRLTGGPLPWPTAVRTAGTAADVLAVAHRRGVVHRDLTAGNVMLTRSGAKIIDFGLARFADPPPAGRASGTVAGSGRPGDDVYSLGVLLYHMLTGRLPYLGVGPGSPATGVRTGALAPTPVLAVAGLPRPVADLCRACMSKRPENRPTSVEAAFALWDLLGGSLGNSGCDRASGGVLSQLC